MRRWNGINDAHKNVHVNGNLFIYAFCLCIPVSAYSPMTQSQIQERKKSTISSGLVTGGTERFSVEHLQNDSVLLSLCVFFL